MGAVIPPRIFQIWVGPQILGTSATWLSRNQTLRGSPIHLGTKGLSTLPRILLPKKTLNLIGLAGQTKSCPHQLWCRDKAHRFSNEICSNSDMKSVRSLVFQVNQKASPAREHPSIYMDKVYLFDPLLSRAENMSLSLSLSLSLFPFLSALTIWLCPKKMTFQCSFCLGPNRADVS